MEEWNHLANQNIAVTFDEMSNDEARFLLNVLIAPLVQNDDGKIISYLHQIGAIYSGRTAGSFILYAILPKYI